MSYVLKINQKPGGDPIKDKGDYLDSLGISSVDFVTVTPDAIKGKAPASTLGLIIKGDMAYSIGAESEDKVQKLTKWANQFVASTETYRAAQVDVIASGQVVRSYFFPQAFIAAYSEGVDEESGGGVFELTLYQKGDLKNDAKISAGFEFKAES